MGEIKKILGKTYTRYVSAITIITAVLPWVFNNVRISVAINIGVVVVAIITTIWIRNRELRKKLDKQNNYNDLSILVTQYREKEKILLKEKDMLIGWQQTLLLQNTELLGWLIAVKALDENIPVHELLREIHK